MDSFHDPFNNPKQIKMTIAIAYPGRPDRPLERLVKNATGSAKVFQDIVRNLESAVEPPVISRTCANQLFYIKDAFIFDRPIGIPKLTLLEAMVLLRTGNKYDIVEQLLPISPKRTELTYAVYMGDDFLVELMTDRGSLVEIITKQPSKNLQHMFINLLESVTTYRILVEYVDNVVNLTPDCMEPLLNKCVQMLSSGVNNSNECLRVYEWTITQYPTVVPFNTLMYHPKLLDVGLGAGIDIPPMALFTMLQLGLVIVPNLIANVNLQLQDDNGRTALMIAISLKRSELARKIVQAGADVNIRSLFGDTALSLAIISHQSEVAQEIIRAGADVNIQSCSGSTPLISAVLTDEPDVARMLLERGADMYWKDQTGKSAADYGIEINNHTTRALMDVGLAIDHLNGDQVRRLPGNPRTNMENWRTIQHNKYQQYVKLIPRWTDEWQVFEPHADYKVVIGTRTVLVSLEKNLSGDPNRSRMKIHNYQSDGEVPVNGSGCPAHLQNHGEYDTYASYRLGHDYEWIVRTTMIVFHLNYLRKLVPYNNAMVGLLMVSRNKLPSRLCRVVGEFLKPFPV